MNEKVSMEISKAAQVLEMSVEQVEEKYLEICSKNNLDANNDAMLSLSLFRQWFSGAAASLRSPAQQTNSLIKKAKGWFISVDIARNIAEQQNQRILTEWGLASEQTYEEGKVATITVEDDGSFLIKRMHKGEEQSKTISNLPDNHHEVDVDYYIVPLDHVVAYGNQANDNYGNPLPVEQYRMSAMFVGTVDGENEGLYYFSYKGVASKDFIPKTFTTYEFDVILDRNNPNRCYGYQTGTLESLTEVEGEDIDVQNTLMTHCADNVVSLVDLNLYHSNCMNKPYAERFVITDGSVSHINAVPNKNNTRRMVITDLNSDFDYEGGSWAGTTCWIPSNLEIDFGILSNVVVIGRTSQGRNEDGTPSDAMINVSGLFVVDNRGVVAEPFVAEEENLDWF
jgi:hypothetical protein